MVRVAVVGCTHGELDAIYDHVKRLNNSSPPNDQVRLVICCGDFESLRNNYDLTCKSCPPKYRHMNNFPEYYTGKKKAPILTVFIGGNHEASNYLRELFYGGWVAPNIFYLGAAGVINVLGLRIAGISGIYNKKFYKCGFFEREPYTKKMVDSIFLVREAHIFQLAHLNSTRSQNSKRIDAILSHDWPRNIELHGDLTSLLEERPDFRESIDNDRFGSPGSELLLSKLRPVKWLAGHMHVRFEATVHHVEEQESSTHFLGLSKCDPGKACVEVVDIPTSTEISGTPNDLRIMMDTEWLAILRKTHHVLTTEKGSVDIPTEPLEITEDDLAQVRARIAFDYSNSKRRRKGLIEGQWITEFSRTALVDKFGVENPPLPNIGNPQTDELLAMLELPHIVTQPYREGVIKLMERNLKMRK